ncbi:hypothetical protein V8C35DRAFT_105187 [Trichoderma chlorosporum]
MNNRISNYISSYLTPLSKTTILDNPIHTKTTTHISKTSSEPATATTVAMCVHFQSWNRCSSCFLTFNRRCNRVPCWNGSVSRWRIHRHGLSCRSGWYERADDEVYTHLPCEACNTEAANGAEDKADAVEARNAGILRELLGRRAAAVATRRRTGIGSVFMRLWSFREALRVRGGSGRNGKRHVRIRIRML